MGQVCALSRILTKATSTQQQQEIHFHSPFALQFLYDSPAFHASPGEEQTAFDCTSKTTFKTAEVCTSFFLSLRAAAVSLGTTRLVRARQSVHVVLGELKPEEVNVGRNVRRRVRLRDHARHVRDVAGRVRDGLLHDPPQAHLAAGDVGVVRRNFVHEVAVDEAVGSRVVARAAQGAVGHEVGADRLALADDAVEVAGAHVVLHLVDGRGHGGHGHDVIQMRRAVVGDPDGTGLRDAGTARDDLNEQRIKRQRIL